MELHSYKVHRRTARAARHRFTVDLPPRPVERIAGNRRWKRRREKRIRAHARRLRREERATDL